MILPIGDQPNPRGVPIVNYLLIAANVAVFLLVTVPLMYRPAGADPLVQQYLREMLERNPALDPAALARSLRSLSAYDVFLMSWGYRAAEPSLLTLFSSMFLHGGWLHLAGNMLFLWIYGDNVEHRLGRLGYLGAYLGTGVLAALGYGALLPAAAGNVPMVGASGAISGVLGFYFLWFPRNKVRVLIVLFPFFFDVWLVGARLVLGFYLVVDNLLPFVLRGNQGGGGVAYGAHIGGFVAGLIVAWLVDRWSASRCRRQAHGCGDRQQDRAAGVRGGRPVEPSVSGLLQARREGDFALAVQSYLALSDRERRAVSVEVVLEFADWLAAEQQPDAALALYGQLLSDHPRGPNLDQVFLGIGLVLLHSKHRPTAAYQYLVNALESSPSPRIEHLAKQALETIAALQKHRIKGRGPHP